MQTPSGGCSKKFGCKNFKTVEVKKIKTKFLFQNSKIIWVY